MERLLQETGNKLEDITGRLRNLHLLLDDVLSDKEFQSFNTQMRESLQRTAMEERNRLEAQMRKEQLSRRLQCSGKLGAWKKLLSLPTNR